MSAVDVAIVGGGPAGLSTALFLASARPELTSRIVVLEKKAYPRDKHCAGAIGARADRLLATIGVRVDVPSVEIDGLSVRTLVGQACERQSRIGRVVRRLEFDHELCRIARSRGIRVEEDARVSKLDIDAGGVSIESPKGSLRARAVIGADGVGSFVRRALGLPAGKLAAEVVELDTEPTSDDLPRDVLHFDVTDRSFPGYAWDFPTVVDGRALVCRGVYHLKLDDRPLDIGAVLRRRLAGQGLDMDRYKVKRFAERGFEPHQPYAAPRALLVGEAAGIDALSGEGIAQAIAYGAFAGEYLAEKLSAGDVSFHDWTSRLARSKVGFELRVRNLLLPYYTGRYRSWFERHFLLQPDFVACSLEHFAGRRVDALRLARTAAAAAWHFVASRAAAER